MTHQPSPLGSVIHSPTIEREQECTSPAAVEEERLYEVVNGERREMERVGAFETALAWVLSYYLGHFALQQKLGLVVTETLFVLDAQRNLKRRPDVAFVSYPRWRDDRVPRAEAWDVVPDLAVEVISPTNLAEEIDDKLTEYFAAGVRLVWVLFPVSGRLYVYQSPERVTGLERSDELDGGDVLPGFRLPVATLFEAVTKPG
jgi:Uma2 family endonuclease